MVYGKGQYLFEIGAFKDVNELFQDIVFNSDYRSQVIHYAVMQNVEHIVFVVATGEKCREGGILYYAIIKLA